MSLHGLLLSTVVMMGVAAKSAQIMRDTRRKRRADTLRVRAIEAQCCRASSNSAARDGDLSHSSASKDSSTKRHV
jgi:hypothetical protein